jgi:hypothetical protein
MRFFVITILLLSMGLLGVACGEPADDALLADSTLVDSIPVEVVDSVVVEVVDSVIVEVVVDSLVVVDSTLVVEGTPAPVTQ